MRCGTVGTFNQVLHEMSDQDLLWNEAIMIDLMHKKFVTLVCRNAIFSSEKQWLRKGEMAQDSPVWMVKKFKEKSLVKKSA